MIKSYLGKRLAAICNYGMIHEKIIVTRKKVYHYITVVFDLSIHAIGTAPHTLLHGLGGTAEATKRIEKKKI